MKSMEWKNVTLKQFINLQELFKIEDETERLISITELLFGDSVTDLPLVEYNKKIKELEFLKEEIPTNHLIKNIKVNGKEYVLHGVLGNITTAQYVDYINHSKTGDIAKILSVFFIPKNHKYNDGYDMLEVINDVGCLPMDVVNSTAFFFSRQLAKFIQIFQSSLQKKIKKMKINDKQKEVMINLLKTLESYHIS